MTIVGSALVDVSGVIVLVWVLNLMRLGRLYVGYGMIFLLVIAGILTTTTVPPVGRRVESMIAAVFPDSGVLIVGFALVLLLLIYILAQMTIISNRVATLVQELAVRHAEPAAPQRGAADGAGGDETRRARG